MKDLPHRYQKGEKLLRELLAQADIQINGQRPWDIQVHEPTFYNRVIAGGSLALGESYMDGWWDCEALDQFFYKILIADLDKKARSMKRLLFDWIITKLFNLQRKSKAYVIGERHYDLGNTLFKNMLDRRMVYSCGYWTNRATLDRAQEVKLDLICRKLGLRANDVVLDIGCGWGSFAKYAAEKYKARVVGITVSKEQISLGRQLCKGLPIELKLQDYRDVEGTFDHIVSIGMFEHVGYKNYKNFMRKVYQCLKEDGLFLLHTIGTSVSTTFTDPWVGKYIFPVGMIPSPKQISSAIEGIFTLEDWHSFGSPHYDKTLLAWYQNFQNNWGQLKNIYDQRFYRMWSYFLLSSAGSFRARKNELWQIVLSKKGIKGGYRSIR